ncbi:MAG TPA: hypothetical protein VF980_06395 [Thermoanaerobaculia bacterium]
MRIVQIVLPGAPEFERKCQRVDFASLSPVHDVIVTQSPHDARAAEVAHIYGPAPLPRQPLIGFPVPYVASSEPQKPRFALRKPATPRIVVSPLATGEGHLPEAVEEQYFNATEDRGLRTEDRDRTIGSFRRPDLDDLIEQTLARIARFRDDVQWKHFDMPPAPADFLDIDVWVDPARDETDFDGFVAEAIAAAKLVVASRTAINSLRLEKGRIGFLVPCSDPNELTHAILTALFKPEVARSKIEAAKQTAGKLRPRQRIRILERLYESLIP